MYTPWIGNILHKRIKEAAVYKRPWLILERLGIEELPQEVFDLVHLDELVVIDNLLVSIPPEIQNLQNLSRVSFFYNEIKSIPTEIGNLKKLTHLDLSCNCLETLPTEILNLDKLQYLDLRYNKIPLPDNILEQVTEPKLILERYFEQLQPVR